MKKYLSIIVLLVLGIAIFNILDALDLYFPDLSQQSLIARFSPVHFNTPGNDFGGGFFWFSTKSLPEAWVTVTAGSETRTCYKQVRGLYYNSQRGDRLWPLDDATKNLLSGSYSSLQISWWLYTTCNGIDGQYSVYWAIKYTRGGAVSYLIAGVPLNFTNNSYDNTKFLNNMQYFNNTTPLGFVFDSAGGIWFVGWILSGQSNLVSFLNQTWNTVNEAFGYDVNRNIISSTWSWLLSGWVISWSTAQDVMWNILVQGNVALSKSINIYERKAFLGNLERRTVILNGSEINSASIINLAKKNAEKICRWTEYVEWQNSITLTAGSKSCYRNIGVLIIDLQDEDSYKNKTIIVKNWNVSLRNWSMKSNSPALDLFIDQGNLYLSNDLAWNYEDFNNDWFPDSTWIVNSGMFLKGTFVINWLLLGWEWTTWTTIGFNHKLHLQGKISTLNTPTQPGTGRFMQVNNIFSWFGDYIFNNRISLENVFVWECGLNGISTDWTSCSSNSNVSITPFVVLNGNFWSDLLK